MALQGGVEAAGSRGRIPRRLAAAILLARAEEPRGEECQQKNDVWGPSVEVEVVQVQAQTQAHAQVQVVQAVQAQAVTQAAMR